MSPHLLAHLINPATNGGEKLDLVPLKKDTNEGISDGILIGNKSKSWFYIMDGILELLPPELCYDRDRTKFINTYSNKLNELNLEFDAPDKASGSNKVQFEQRQHYDTFSEGTEVSYDDFENQPFWKAVDSIVFSKWDDKVAANNLVLDVGCGNGRSSFRIATPEAKVIGIDISKELIKRAIERSNEKGLTNDQLFFLSDANELPFKDNTFDFAITSGVLSQLPNPEKTCKEIQRVLKPGGIHFGLENNKSVFRVVFDLLTKFFKNWENVTGTIPECDEKMLSNWAGKNATEISSYTTVFLPPSIYNIFGDKGAESMFKISDALFKIIPGFARNGGLIVFEIKKK
jgi:ubiquinone/menaquinone biosynthesis C-methylase UbiE/uncharacterized protein YbaR (Trm112 family)